MQLFWCVHEEAIRQSAEFLSTLVMFHTHLEGSCGAIVQSSYCSSPSFLICPALAFPWDQHVRLLNHFLSNTFLRKNHLNDLRTWQANMSRFESAVLGTGWHSPWQPEKTSKLYPAILTHKWRNLPRVGAFHTWNFL